jgi:alpha-beta hydrolase superfamily lysophospholipase
MTRSVLWSADVLGTPFEAAALELRSDTHGEPVATLVRRVIDPDSSARRAILYVHGFNDYFFQTELAAWFIAHGLDFYAIDLRRYGRSLRPGQPACYCADLAEYDEELDLAAEVILAEGHDDLLVVAHSTGGLTAPLWAARRPNLPITGLMLNSPFFAFKQSATVQAIVGTLARAVARVDPLRVISSSKSTGYGDSLHASRHGEWNYDLAWKPSPSFPVRGGWLRAVLDGHRTLRAGLDLAMPVLVMSSTRTVTAHGWDEVLRRGDAVLDGDAVARIAPALGGNVTIERVEDGMHDLVLSPRPSRDRAYMAMAAWLDTHFGERPGATKPPRTP